MRSIEDLAKLLLGRVRHSVASLREVVSYFRGLGSIKSGKQQRKPFVVHPHPVGLRPGLSYDNVEELIEVLEGAAHT
jgi:hypothetical protein